MADMADLQQVEQAWTDLNSVLDADAEVTPVTYINSAANLKSFCGIHGGIVCTSTNAQKIIEWSFNQREKVFFFPDQHLGRKAKVFLWKGFCSVHQMFKPEQIEKFREENPAGIVISHPESSFEVCQMSDYIGSTEFIINTITEGAPGTHWLVATELNLVNRLAEEMKADNKIVQFMSPMVCMCSTMFRIDPQHLAWVLENLAGGHVVNQISVDSDVAHNARTALQRMFDVF